MMGPVQTRAPVSVLYGPTPEPMVGPCVFCGTLIQRETCADRKGPCPTCGWLYPLGDCSDG